MLATLQCDAAGRPRVPLSGSLATLIGTRPGVVSRACVSA